MPCSPRMTKCKASCAHRALVEAFRLEAIHWQQRAEEASLGYDTELAEWEADNPQPNLKDWLRAHKRPDPPAEREVAA